MTMKTFNYILSFIVGLLVLSSCDSDRDSNPTLQTPTKFVLNTPSYVNGVYDLKEANTVLLTCSQPDYGFAAPVSYAVQVATDANFSKFATLPTNYTTARMDVSAFEIAKAIVPLLGVETADKFPTTAFPLYFRLKAFIPGVTRDSIASNVITLPQVKSYFALDAMTMPTNLYAIGDFCGWDWTKSFSMIPVNGNSDKFWALLWCEKDKGMKFNTATAWDGGQFGVADNVKINGISYSTNGDKNIVFGETGWRLVMATVKIVGRSYSYTFDFSQPDVYIYGAANGGTWAADNNWKFTVPTTADGEFVSPALLATAGTDASCLRMCVVLSPDIDWWRSEFIILDGKIAYRGNGKDQTRVGCGAGQKAYLNILAGTGSVK